MFSPIFTPHQFKVVLGFNWEHDMHPLLVDGFSLPSVKTEDNLKTIEEKKSSFFPDPVQRIFVPLQEVSDHSKSYVARGLLITNIQASILTTKIIHIRIENGANLSSAAFEKALT